MQANRVSRQSGSTFHSPFPALPVDAISGIFPSDPGQVMPTFYTTFRECANRWPENAALEIQLHDQVESYTYFQVKQMAESVGRWLKQNSFEPGSRCAILANNHPRWVAAYLGIIAAGCTAVP